MFSILKELASLDQSNDEQSAKVFAANWPYTEAEALRMIELERQTQQRIAAFKAA
jgi:hypothetical protein